MASLNQCNFIGRLVRDPETIQAKSGTEICKGAIAVDCGYGDKKTSMFLNFVLFGKKAEAFGKYLNKGDVVFISGELRQNEWTNKQGEKVKQHELAVDKWGFGQAKGGKPSRNGHAKSQYEADPEGPPRDEDIPF